MTEIVEWIEDWDGSWHVVVGQLVRSTYCILVIRDDYGEEHYIYRWEVTDRRKLHD